VVHGVLTLGVGGLERMALALARRQGAAVLCVGPAGPLAADAGVPVVALDKPDGRRPEWVAKAAAALKELKPDVVHTHQIGAAAYLGPAAGRLGVPVLHTEHGNLFARTRGLLPTLKARVVMRSAARHVGRFYCVSDDIARAVTRWRTVPRHKVEVVPNGVELPADEGADVRAALGIPADAPVVGTVGRLAEVKRQDVLVRAAAKLAERWPGLRLLVVGDGPERAALERLAAAVGLGGRAVFAGYRPHPEAYLRAMDVFALTSRSEGFPVALLEAWACGVPAVCTAVGGVPAVVEPGTNGLLVPPGDADAVAAAVGSLLADRATAARMAAAGRAAVRDRYSLAAVADGYARRYQALTRGANG
jgi:glycosyltransferase involved in cell wall biosynthesis